MAQHSIYDAVVIGGGINGTSAARELAKAGYTVALIEADDLASGASSRSSRILHCGLRYLETDHPVREHLLNPISFLNALGMAREAMQSRAELSQDSSVSTRAINMHFPIWRAGPFPGWQLSVGLLLLKMLGPSHPSLETDILNRRRTLKHPLSMDLRDRDSLQGMAVYREYLFTEPERICIDAAVEACHYGAELFLKSTASIGALDKDGLWNIEIAGINKNCCLKARSVVNVAGSWANNIGSFRHRLVQGTKGAHIVVRLPERYRNNGLTTLHRGGHPFYCLPIGDGNFYFGPTETIYDGDARNVHTDNTDIEFLLAEANYFLPKLNLKRSDIQYTWAGIRPLTWDPKQPMGARHRTLHDLSIRGYPNILALTAGPIMSHRSAGRLLAEAVQNRIGKPSSLSKIPQPFKPTRINDPVAHAVTHEYAQDIYGVLVHRTGAVWDGLKSREEVSIIAEQMARKLEWSACQTSNETDRFLDLQKHRFGVPEK